MSNPLAPNPPAADAAADPDDVREQTAQSGWNVLTYHLATGMPTAIKRSQMLQRDARRRMARLNKRGR